MIQKFNMASVTVSNENAKVVLDFNDTKLELLEAFGANFTNFGIAVSRFLFVLFGSNTRNTLHSNTDYGCALTFFTLLDLYEVKNPKNIVKAFQKIVNEFDVTKIAPDFKEKCRKFNSMLEKRLQILCAQLVF